MIMDIVRAISIAIGFALAWPFGLTILITYKLKINDAAFFYINLLGVFLSIAWLIIITTVFGLGAIKWLWEAL